MKKLAVLSLCLAFTLMALIPTYLHADTIRMMQYNLMYYTTQGPEGCDDISNNLAAKDAAMKKIIKYVQPDVLCVNEIGKSDDYAQRLLNNTLNVDGVNYYATCPTTSSSSSYITTGNRLFYNTKKLGYHSSSYIPTSVAYINAYKMYYKTNRLAAGDTIFTTFYVLHLKAGSSESNATTRLTQAQALMSRISAGKAGNFVLSGDFNIYGASEQSYQHITHYSNSLYRFCDPISREEEWHANRNCASIHTQSTHSWGDCFAGGGLDDRFDFILVSPYILYGSQKVQSINSSYHAVGQDGNRYNGEVNSPYNNAVPEEIAEALYTMSDHLPVVLDFNIKTTTGIDEYVSSHSVLANVVNPVRDNKLELNIFSDDERTLTFRLYTTDGRLITTFAEPVHEGENRITKEFPYSPALYFLQILDGQKQVITKKIAKF